VIIVLPSLSQTLPTKLKRITPLCQTERGAAGLISRFVEYIRVARLLVHGAHFLNIVVVHRIVLSIAYRLVLLIAYRPVFVSRIVTLRLVSSSDHRVSVLRFTLVDGPSRDSAIPRATQGSSHRKH